MENKPHIWEHSSYTLSYGTREEIGVKKLVAKLPMSNIVIDSDYQMFKYEHYEDGVTRFVYIGSSMIEVNAPSSMY
jgi:hypothetical protein